MLLLRLAVGIFMAVIFSVVPCFAQFPDLGKFTSNKTSTGAGSSVSVQDLINNKNKTLGAYINSIHSMTLGLGKTAEAFGVKNQITDKLAIINSLQTGNLNDTNLARARAALDTVLGVIREKMQASTGLNTGSQSLFKQGIADLAGSVQNMQGLISEAKNLFSMAQGALGTSSLQDKIKVQDIISTASILYKNIPLDLKSNQGMLSVLTNFASAHNIAIPKETADLLNLIR